MRTLFGISLAILILTLLASCHRPADATSRITADPARINHVIYGDDNRLDYTDVDDQDLRDMARSTVALISTEHMVYDSVFDKYNLEKPDLNIPICVSERFRKQPLFAHCSGSLIAPDLVLTAGHCMREAKDCKNTKFVFDYTALEKDMVLNSVRAANVYGCKETVYNSERKIAADFAIVRLDREVVGRKPFQLSQKILSLSEKLFMIGHPAGLPTKFTMEGKVRSLIPQAYFTISIDAFAGNSGSPVFDMDAHEIIGILSRGESDYERQNSCYVSKHCPEDGCRGEDVTRATEIIKYLPKPVSDF